MIQREFCVGNCVEWWELISLMWCTGLYVNIIWALCEDLKILLMSIVYVIYKIP